MGKSSKNPGEIIKKIRKTKIIKKSKEKSSKNSGKNHQISGAKTSQKSGKQKSSKNPNKNCQKNQGKLVKNPGRSHQKKNPENRSHQKIQEKIGKNYLKKPCKQHLCHFAIFFFCENVLNLLGHLCEFYLFLKLAKSCSL